MNNLRFFISKFSLGDFFMFSLRRYLTTFLLGVFVSSAYAVDVVIDPKDRYIIGATQEVEPNPNDFNNKKYDIGLGESMDFRELLRFIQDSKRYTDDNKFYITLNELNIDNRNSAFELNRLKKEKAKYVAIYDRALDTAKNYVTSIESIIIKDYMPKQIFDSRRISPDSSIFNNGIPSISEETYDFEKEILSLPNLCGYPQSLYPCNFELGNFLVADKSESLKCEEDYSCYYIHIPSDIAEQLYNLNRERYTSGGYTAVLDIWLTSTKEIGGNENFPSLTAIVDKIDVVFLKNNAYVNYNLSNNIRYSPEILNREEIYRTELKTKKSSLTLGENSVKNVLSNNTKETFSCETPKGKKILVENDEENYIYQFSNPQKIELSISNKISDVEKLSKEGSWVFKNGNTYYRVFNYNGGGVDVLKGIGENEKLIATVNCK